MVVIFSENNDVSTNHVLDWVTSFGYPFERINTDDKVELVDLELNNFKILINGKRKIEYKEITSIWFRRGEVKFENRINELKTNDEDKFTNYLKQHLKVELEAYSFYVNYLLLKKRKIGNFEKVHLNKFFILEKAKECKLNIPFTHIISNKNDLINDISKYNELITKSSNYVLNFEYLENNYMTYTEVVNKKNIKNLPNFFAPSLCQNLIHKLFDIRIFYFNGLFFSMAIFSQSDEESKIDFRKYNYINPVRQVPFKLENSIQKKISKLMKSIDLDSGSIDMIVDKEGNYYFLEINPVGQYGMVEYPCNYTINKTIAKYLVYG
jgi:ATP-GRASP peptide maturase of grasp-with-spasm system